MMANSQSTSDQLLNSAGAARHVGRVGALAVALGVGFAVASTTGVAWADESANGPDSASAPVLKSTTPAAGPAGSVLDAAGDASASAKANRPSGQTRAGNAGVAVGDKDAPEVTVDTSGGANATVNGQTANPKRHPKASGAKDADGNGDDASETTTAGAPGSAKKSKKSTAAPAASKPASVSAVAHAAEGVATAITAPGSSVSAPAGRALASSEKSGSTIASIATAPTGHAEASARKTSTTAPLSAASTTPTATSNPPDIIASFVSAVLAPFAAPAKGTPGAPAAMWTVLAWVRREIETATDKLATPPTAQTTTGQTLARTATPTALTAAATPTPPPSGLLPTVSAVVTGVGNIVGGLVGFLGTIVGGVVNQPPTAKPQFTNIDTTTGIVTGKLNATDPNNDALTYAVTTAATQGTATVDATGTFTYTPTSTARANAAQTSGDDVDAFTITITDARGAKTAVAINNAPITPAPTITDLHLGLTDFVATTADGTKAIAVTRDAATSKAVLAVVNTDTNAVRSIALDGYLSGIDITDDGRIAAVALSDTQLGSGTKVAFVDTTTGAVTSVPVPAQGVLLSPNGRYAYARAGNQVTIIDSQTLATKAVQLPAGATVYYGGTIAVRPDNTGIVVSSFDTEPTPSGGTNTYSTILVIDNAGNIDTYRPPHETYLEAPLISPDGSHVYARSGDGGLHVTAIDLAAKSIHDAQIDNQPKDSFQVATNADGSRVYAFHGNGVTVLDASGSFVREIALDKEYNTFRTANFAFAGDRSRAFVGDGASITSVDLQTGITRTFTTGPTSELLASPSGRWVAFKRPDATQLGVLDTTDSSVTTVNTSDPTFSYVGDMQFSADGRRLYGDYYTGNLAYHNIAAIDLTTKTTGTLPLTGYRYPGEETFAYTPSGSDFYVAVASGPESNPTYTLVNVALPQIRTGSGAQTLSSQAIAPSARAAAPTASVAPVALSAPASTPTALTAAATPTPPPSGLLPTVSAVVTGVGNIVGGLVGFLGTIVGGVVNQPPTAKPQFTNIDTTTGIVTGKLNATDPNNDALTYAVTTAATQGTATVDATGTFTYTPSAQARLNAYRTPGDDVDTFTITITDARGAKTTATINNTPITPARDAVIGSATVPGYAWVPEQHDVTSANGIRYFTYAGDGTTADPAVTRIVLTHPSGTTTSTTIQGALERDDQAPDGTIYLTVVTGDGSAALPYQSAVVAVDQAGATRTVHATSERVRDVAFAGNGTVYVSSNTDNHSTLTVIRPNGTVTNYASTGYPDGVVVGADGTVAHMTHTYPNGPFTTSVTVVRPDGTSTVATSPGISPQAVIASGGTVYFANKLDSQATLTTIAPDGVTTTRNAPGDSTSVLVAPNGTAYWFTQSSGPSPQTTITTIDSHGATTTRTLPGYAGGGVIDATNTVYYTAVDGGVATMTFVRADGTTSTYQLAGTPTSGPVIAKDGTLYKTSTTTSGGTSQTNILVIRPDGTTASYAMAGYPADSRGVTIASDGTAVQLARTANGQTNQLVIHADGATTAKTFSDYVYGVVVADNGTVATITATGTYTPTAQTTFTIVYPDHSSTIRSVAANPGTMVVGKDGTVFVATTTGDGSTTPTASTVTVVHPDRTTSTFTVPGQVADIVTTTEGPVLFVSDTGTGGTKFTWIATAST